MLLRHSLLLLYKSDVVDRFFQSVKQVLWSLTSYDISTAFYVLKRDHDQYVFVTTLASDQGLD